jgi:C-terminal processing protease CtpA/Prc
MLSCKPFVLVFLSCLCSLGHPVQKNLKPEQYAADFNTMWSTLRDGYAYFDAKQTDWNKVREVYGLKAATIKNRDEFVRLLEDALDEVHDHHTSLNTNLNSSSRLVPSGLDVWAEWIDGRPVITQLRSGFSAEQAKLKVGMVIVSINGVPVKEAVDRRMPKLVKKVDDGVRRWALLEVLAGTHDLARVIEAQDKRGTVVAYKLDLPSHNRVDKYQYPERIDWKMLPNNIGYIKVNDLISDGIVGQFDSALKQLRHSRGLILDLRDIPRGGNTDVAEPILSRFIDRQMGYQLVVPMHKHAYSKQLSPRGPWAYKSPMVVLVNHWTGSMGEGMAIGLDGMKRATVVGTRMAGLNGGVFSTELPNTKIRVNYVGEKLNHLNGSPRETFAPPVLVNLQELESNRVADPILEKGLSHLTKLINH